MMFQSRRTVYFAICITLFAVYLISSRARSQPQLSIIESERQPRPQPSTTSTGLKTADKETQLTATTVAESSPNNADTTSGIPTQPDFAPGMIKPEGSTYSQVLVVARLKSEDVSWIQQELPDLETAIYTVDDPEAPYKVPENKGHEAMVYLTYIIDNYNELPDTSIFIHSHRITWHNNDLLKSDASKMLKRLNNERVARDGYFNLRCHQHPGCPDWIDLKKTEEDINKKEEVLFAKVWAELHIDDPMPDTLAQACCAQFAVSRDRVRSIPLARWHHYRNWLLNTDMDSTVSGRIWEYTWQYVFTGQSSFCPSMDVCYCDGYRICFGSEQNIGDYFEARESHRELVEKLKEKDGSSEATIKMEAQIEALKVKMDEEEAKAFKQGDDPAFRESVLGHT
jgi:Protein of unknown function (DUF3431)